MIEHRNDIPSALRDRLEKGAVIPAHPLVLTRERKLDEVRQRAVTRYYLDAGAHGIAVGVHTTQFGIRKHGLYEPVLRLAAETAHDWQNGRALLVAGVSGLTNQAMVEARLARSLGYHAALLNLAPLKDQSDEKILEHCRRIAEVMPIIGFALLPAVGGMHLSYRFWRAFAEIENVVAIKMAPFDRYRTLDIIRAVADADALDRITLYTGNDDHIVLDLVVPFVVRDDAGRGERRVRIRGGLLGHWSVWTRSAVQLLDRIHALPDGADVPTDILALDSIVTDCNAAIYDAANTLAGCIPGCMEVLRRQGLLDNLVCLDAGECLSLGQREEIDRVYRQYPEMNDDRFVRENLDRWLAEDGPLIPLQH